MAISEKIYSLSKIMSVYSLLFFAIIDTVAVIIVKFRRTSLDNGYMNFHKKHGFVKVTLLKLAAMIAIIYGLLAPMGNSGALVIPIVAYGIFVFTLIIDLIRQKTDIYIENKMNEKHNKTLQ